MGFLDDIFGGKEEVKYLDSRAVKGTSAQDARDFLKNLLGDVKDFKFPTQKVSGLSAPEQQGQGILSDILSGDAFRDPLTSRFYSGLRAESLADEERTVSALRNRQQLGGAFNSSRAIGEEGRLRGDFSNQRQTALGRLFEFESERDNPYTRLQAATQFGALPRLLEQASSDAEFNSILQTMLFPFTQGQGVANNLLNSEIRTMPTVTQSPSLFSQIGAVAGPILGTLGGLGVFGGGGAEGGGLPLPTSDFGPRAFGSSPSKAPLGKFSLPTSTGYNPFG